MKTTEFTLTITGLPCAYISQQNFTGGNNLTKPYKPNFTEHPLCLYLQKNMARQALMIQKYLRLYKGYLRLAISRLISSSKICSNLGERVSTKRSRYHCGISVPLPTSFLISSNSDGLGTQWRYVWGVLIPR